MMMSTRGFGSNIEKASMAGKIGGKLSKRGYGKPGKILEENEEFIRNELKKGRYLHHIVAELGVKRAAATNWAKKKGIEFRHRAIKKMALEKRFEIKKEEK